MRRHLASQSIGSFEVLAKGSAHELVVKTDLLQVQLDSFRENVTNSAHGLVMPNHVHAVLWPMKGCSLSEILQEIAHGQSSYGYFRAAGRAPSMAGETHCRYRGYKKSETGFPRSRVRSQYLDFIERPDRTSSGQQYLRSE